MEPTSPILPLRERIDRALAMCRPYLQKDEGDVELVGISEDGIVEVRFKGTCVICPMSRMTLRAGLERVVLQSAPEVKRIEAIK